MKSAIILGLLLTAGAASAEAPFSKERLDWNKPHKPFRIIGNIYYVGMEGVSAFLIATPDGLILTDGALPESAPFIEKNIQALGFRLKDVKILLNSHAHFDHSGGLAQLKRDTGAVLYASAADKPVLESGHIAFGPAANMDAPKVKVDHVVADGETVALGGTTLTAHLTPGHTQGCTTWTTSVKDGAATRSVMFFCSISVAGNPLVGNAAYPRIADDYKASFKNMEAMKTDVFFAPHGVQFGLDAKFAKLKPGAPNPFVDPDELHRFMAEAKKDFDAQLAKQQVKK